jgi:hypothetical protein
MAGTAGTTGDRAVPERKADDIKYHYVFKFFDGSSASVEVFLDAETLAIDTQPGEPPDWARLEYNQCPGCPLDTSRHEYCPIAVNIAHLVSSFGDFSSSETAHIIVMTRQRDYSKSTTVRDGLTSLLGIYMVTSGCPIMEKLKPLVRYHLPFLSLEENVFRVVSMYLLIQYFLMKKGKRPDWGLEKLETIYDHIRRVNAGVAKRIKNAAKKEASLIALANLDNLASLIPFLVDETLDRIGASLESYLEEPNA